MPRNFRDVTGVTNGAWHVDSQPPLPPPRVHHSGVPLALPLMLALSLGVFNGHCPRDRVGGGALLRAGSRHIMGDAGEGRQQTLSMRRCPVTCATDWAAARRMDAQ